MEFEQEISFGGRALSARREPGSEALAGMVERQARFVYRVAFSVLRNASDAEDVVQETFLKLHRSGKWRDVVDEKAFLARTAWRIAVDRAPKRRADEPGVELADPGENPEEAAISADWNATVQRLLDSLPAELRLPLALSSVEEMSSGEIAAVMGIPEGTVRTRIMRARSVLRGKIAHFREGGNER